MERLASFIRKRSLWIILAVLALSVFSATFISRIRYSDDITAFFPENSKEVTLFKDVSDEFGGLDIALVGIETDDLFTLQNLRMLRAASRQIKSIDGVASVTSITEMRDFEEKKIGEETGSLIQDLVGELPGDMSADELKALRDKVLSREHLVGSVVSKKGDAALIICKLERASSLWKVSNEIKQAVASAVGARKDVRVYYGGAPFISAYITEGTQSDVVRLSPWVALTVVIIIFLSFHSVWAALLALLALIIGLVVTVGFMPLLGLPMDLVSTSLPMILASIGAAYGIHVLARYFMILSLKKDVVRTDAVQDTFKQVGIPVIMSGLTTVVGFASFLVMDIKPLRNFGFVMAIGVFVCLVVSMLFIGAILNRVRIGKPGKGETGELIGDILHGIALRVSSYPRTAMAVFFLVLFVSVYYVTRITSETTTESYFPHDSEPVRSDEFMVQRFGGSLFLQLYVRGDIKSPLVLREMQKMEDAVGRIEGATEVQSITMPVSLASSALTGKEEIPPRRDQVASLVYLVEDDPAVHMLVHREWTSALTQVRVKGYDMKKARNVWEGIQAYVDKNLRKDLYSVSLGAVGDEALRQRLMTEARQEAAAKIHADLEKALGRKLGAAAVGREVEKVLGEGAGACSGDVGRKIDEILRRDLIDDELVYIDGSLDWNALVAAVCDRLVSGSLGEDSLYWHLYAFATEEEKTAEEEALKRFEEEGKTAGVTGFRKGVRLVLGDLRDGYNREAVDAILRPFAGDLAGKNPAKYRKLAGKATQHLDWTSTGEVVVGSVEGIRPEAVTGSKRIGVQVTGYPILNHRMNQSVTFNQIKATAVALVIVLVLVAIMYKSLIIGLIAAAPAVITLLMVFASLGVTGVPMDMGVSMVSQIAIGAAVDYPIHFFWKYKEVADRGFHDALQETMRTTGRAIALNALEVMAGFGLLVFAVVTPVRKAGVLIAATLLISAVVTLFFMPVMVRLWEKKVVEKLRG